MNSRSSANSPDSRIASATASTSACAVSGVSTSMVTCSPMVATSLAGLLASHQGLARKAVAVGVDEVGVVRTARLPDRQCLRPGLEVVAVVEVCANGIERAACRTRDVDAL